VEVDMYYKSEEVERRCLPTSEVRIDGDSAPKITGYAAVFDVWADIGGWFREKIKPGAFAKTIKEADVRALMNHNENYVLGRNKAGTLKLREDSKGLAVEIDPAPTTWANDLMTSMRRGDVNQMSFGFTVNKSEVDYDKDERVLTDLTLFDVSVVTFPAYPTTSAQVRSAFQKKPKEETTEMGMIYSPEIIAEMDELFEKIKAGKKLTEDELRVLTTYIPSLTVPPAKHTETPPEPPAKHSASDTRKGDKWTELYIRAEMQIPSIN
jgi:HK97 family phage prohead protease